MEVTVNVPDSKSDPLLKQLLTQFEALQKQLSKLKQPDSSKQVLQMLGKQQDSLVKAMERVADMVGKRNGNGNNDAILQAVKGLKQTLSKLPDALSSAMDGSFKHTQQAISRPKVTVQPQIKVSLGGLNKRLDRIENALPPAPKRFRTRTFGSTY